MKLTEWLTVIGGQIEFRGYHDEIDVVPGHVMKNTTIGPGRWLAELQHVHTRRCARMYGDGVARCASGTGPTPLAAVRDMCAEIQRLVLTHNPRYVLAWSEAEERLGSGIYVPAKMTIDLTVKEKS